MTKFYNLYRQIEDKIPNGIEFFYPNYWYGFSYILKRYSHWPLPLPVVIPHGVDFGTTNICEGELKSGLPGIYCYQHFREDIYKRFGSTQLIKGASPWLYLLKMKGFKGIDEGKASGIIVFPPHSSVSIDSYIDDEISFIDKVKVLENQFGKATICFYWKDILNKRHIAFERLGYRIVTAGNMFDPYFSDHLFEILKDKKYLYTPIIGSHIFYAASMGIDIILDEELETKFIAPKEVLQKDLWQADQEILESIRLTFSSNSLLSKKEFACNFLGAKHLKSPLILFMQFLMASLKKGWIITSIKQWLDSDPGEPFINLDKLQISNWGPHDGTVSNPPNIQENGDGAFWININPGKILIDGDLYLGNNKAKVTNRNPGQLTAAFDPKIFDFSFTGELSIINSTHTKILKIGNFSTYPQNSI